MSEEELPQEFFDEAFESMTARLSHPIGAAELQNRHMFGDEEYERQMALGHANDVANLNINTSQVFYIRSRASFYRSLRTLTLCVSGLLVGWSIFFWVH